MDAGIAAVLGAAVGAVGTAVTGATAAYLSRSTAQQQVRTDVRKVLRESRRATYASYAKTIDHYLEKLATTLTPLGRVKRMPEQGEMWTERAHLRWEEALKYRKAEVDTQKVLLRLDATRPVTDASLEVSKRCVLLSSATNRAIATLKGEALDGGPLSPPAAGHLQLLRAAGVDPEEPDLDVLMSQARAAYDAFLSAAAADLGEGGITT